MGGEVILLERLDAYGMGDPDNFEGHPEGRCNVCERLWWMA